MTYTYNLSGALIEQRYPSGRVVKNLLDGDGELATVQSKKNQNYAFWNYANHFSYNSAGAVTSMQLGNGRWESTQFNSRLQPTQIALGSVQGGTDKLKLNYEYGSLDVGTGVTDFTKNNGNISKQTITVASVGATPGFVATQYYAYDQLNRIQIATENITPVGGQEQTSWRQSFSYDRYGNRNFVTTGPTATTTLGTCPTEVCYPTISPSNNKLTSTGYTFDASGNTIRDAQDRKFTYDAENKQTKVETVSGETVTGTIGQYFYDGDGKRIKKRAYVDNVLTEETIFVYDAGGKLIGEYSNEVASLQDAKVAYLTNDHLGSPRINTDATGAVTARHDYHPFGEEVVTSHRTTGLGYIDDTIRKQFTGYERDKEINLDHAQARYSSYTLGRFTSPDPLAASAGPSRPQSWNRYSYSYNNPLRFTDPSGMVAGDFYNLDGKKIGTDGIDDKKIHIVLDNDKAKEIEKTKGNYAGTVDSKFTLPNVDVVTAVGDAVKRSDSATFDKSGLSPLKSDALTRQVASGGFSEAGVSWKTTDGKTEITAAPDGPYSDPRIKDGTATISQPSDSDGDAHIHPSGKIETIDRISSSSGVTTSVGGIIRTPDALFSRRQLLI